jgi:CHAT domain-containing protein
VAAMDAQQIQAYVGLIEQLLGCDQGEEAALLQANAELVNAELVAVMGQYVEYLKGEGEGNTAEWLQGFVMQLVQALGIKDRKTVRVEDTASFFPQTLKLVAKSQGDARQVYSFWAKQQGQFNEELLEMMPQIVARWFEGKTEQRITVAAILGTFGNLINQFPLGDRQLNLELGIQAYELVLQVYTRHAFPEDWAAVQNNLALAYRNRIRGDRANNLEKSIMAYELALQVRTRHAFPEDWAATQNNLTLAYSDRIQGDRADNIEKSITACELALEVYTRNIFPEGWAAAHHNLAIAYGNRIRGDRADNLEKSITAYELALQVRTRYAFPEDWAMTQSSLANIYNDRIRGDRADNIEKSITACELAFQVYTLEASPEKWAITQNNLATAYSGRIRGDRAENIEKSIASYKLALQVCTHEVFPEDWAMTQNNLAIAYSDRIQGDRADNLGNSIAAYELALQVRTRHAFPEKWAMTRNNLATAYNNRIRGDRADNLEKSVEACESALQVYTLEAFPEDWAMTQNNLADAYSNRIRGDRADNLEKSIAAYESALQIYTHNAFPERWATTQNGMAAAYSNRVQGDRAGNMKRSIGAYSLALQVFTRDEFPESWAMTQNNLAAAYNNEIGDRGKNIEQSIAAYELALQVHTRNAFPEKCRTTARNLGNLHFEQNNWTAALSVYKESFAAAEILYRNCILLDSKAAQLANTNDLPRKLASVFAQTGNLRQAIETLELGRTRGLTENLDRDRSDLTQLQQINSTLHDQYKNTTNQIRNIEAQQRDRMVRADRHSLTPEILRNTVTNLQLELEEIIEQIRQVSSYEDFLTPTKWEDIEITLRSDNPLIYLVTAPNGSLMLIATPDNIEAIWSDFTEGQLHALVQTWLSAYRQQQTDRITWLDTIDTTTRNLWDSLMGPIVQHLKSLGIDRATLIPTGLLSLLPLHAAWTEDSSCPTDRRYALDEIHFTYTPNARSLTAAREIADRVKADAILAIDEPKHRYLAPDTTEFKPVAPLPSSSREVASAIATFPSPKVLLHTEATRQAVLDALPNINVLHCSCHGNVNFQEPLKSGLAMTGDGEAAVLTLRDFLDLKLTDGDRGGIRLAILSACETGLPGLENIDEVVSLPIGLLQAGVAGVISSLWSVPELSTMVLLSRFYTLWRDQKQPPDQALRQAQQWLRDASANEVIVHCQTFIPELASEQGPLYRALRQDFSHPYNWAAFSYMGV